MAAASVEFRWSGRDILVSGLRCAYASRLPVIALVTGGHEDPEGDDYGRGEIYRIFAVSPCGKFVQAHSIVNGEVIPCIQDAQMEDAWANGRIPLEDVPDRLKGALSIPTDIPLSLQVCVGLEGGSASDYQQLLESYHIQTLDWGTNAETDAYENVQFSPDVDGGEYLTIIPGKEREQQIFKQDGKPRQRPTMVVRPVEKQTAEKASVKCPPKTLPKPTARPAKQPSTVSSAVRNQHNSSHIVYDNNTTSFSSSSDPKGQSDGLSPDTKPKSGPTSPTATSSDTKPQSGPTSPTATSSDTKPQSGPTSPTATSSGAVPSMGASKISSSDVISNPELNATSDESSDTAPHPALDASNDFYVKSNADQNSPVEESSEAGLNYEPLIKNNSPGISRQQSNNPAKPNVRASIYSSRNIRYEPPTLGNAAEFVDLASVPDDIGDLSVSQLSDCLAQLQLGKYATALSEGLVDGGLLKSMENKAEMEEMMSEHFRMTKMEVHRLWMFAQKGWRPKFT